MNNNNYESDSDNESEVNTWFCDHCDDERGDDANHYSMGNFNDLCEDCYDELQSSSFVCDCCNNVEEILFMVEDQEYSGTEHSTCFDCFIDRVVKDLPAPSCECGKPCKIKNDEAITEQLQRKNELEDDGCDTKHSFHNDCCKVCYFAEYLADWNQIPAPDDVGLVGDELRLILGDDLSAMINRCLGGTEISKRFKGEERPKLKRFSFTSEKNKWSWERISYMRAKLDRDISYNVTNRIQRRIFANVLFERIYLETAFIECNQKPL